MNRKRAGLGGLGGRGARRGCKGCCSVLGELQSLPSATGDCSADEGEVLHIRTGHAGLPPSAVFPRKKV